MNQFNKDIEVHPEFLGDEHEINSEEVNEIVMSIPSWIIRWGITLVFAVIMLILLFSALIQYPDVVTTSLKINSANSPKTVLSKQNGKLSELIVSDGQQVYKDQILAFLESNSNPVDILTLQTELKRMQTNLTHSSMEEQLPQNLLLGDLQSAYQIFCQEYEQYRATLANGYFTNKRKFLVKELENITVLRHNIDVQQANQKRRSKNDETEYQSYQKLFKNNVISRSEFRQVENKYLDAKLPLQQSENEKINNASQFSAKEKELLELDYLIAEQKTKFVQSLNRCLTETEAWILLHVLKSPISGRVSFSGVLQQNINVFANEELFIVNPGNTDFFGVVRIPQYNMGKIKVGQQALVKLHSYPFEQYGLINGKLSYISDVAANDSVFIGKVTFGTIKSADLTHPIALKNGMLADVEIITENSSLLKRFFRGITKVLQK